ncbi:chlorohydrolase [Streptococcus pneumoniae]|nr:chlorohydrolase [Streptococcus pneumoniae]
MKLTKSVTYIYGKAKLTWFEEIFEEYKIKFYPTDPSIS